MSIQIQITNLKPIKYYPVFSCNIEDFVEAKGKPRIYPE